MGRRRIARKEKPEPVDTSLGVAPEVAAIAGFDIPSDTSLAIRALMRQAEEASTDLTLFYNFVMKHEITKVPLKAAPHQELLFDFIQEHDRTVIRMPVGCGKTFSMAAYALFMLGKDVTQRGGVVSKVQKQAAKVIGMIADYIQEPTLNANLTMVFPDLRKSPRIADKWTANQITVDRDPGIRDASVVALGVESTAAGARLSWLASDDTIDDENTNTKVARDHVNNRFDSKHISRLDPDNSRAVTMNTPWNREDLTYHLENSGWPTITMDIYGYIWVTNATAAWMARAERLFLRRSLTRPDAYRLRAFDPDDSEETPLWPERYSSEAIHRIRYGRNGKGGGMLPHQFARTFLCQPFDEGAARCQREWIERCKSLGMGLSMVSRYTGPNPTYTGLDLGIGTSGKSDLTVFFTFERMPNGMKRILDIESGRWDGHLIVDKLIQKHDAFGSMVAVENNQGQDFIRQWALQQRPDLKIKAHTTNAQNKRSVDFGVESLFTEFQNGAWIIPCDQDGNVHPEIQLLIDAALYYQPPPAHTPDHLMSMWIAGERGRRSTYTDPQPTVGRRREGCATGGF